MADPVFVDVPKDAWKKIATNVKTGQINILYPTNDDWYYTYKNTGGAAPTTELPEVKLNFQASAIDSAVFIDVYVYVKNQDGRVRVDL